jgi:hypothetical protein
VRGKWRSATLIWACLRLRAPAYVPVSYCAAPSVPPCIRGSGCPGRELTCLAVCSLARRTAAVHPMPRTNRCSHHGYRTALHYTRSHRLRPAPIFCPDFYPKGQPSGVDVSYVLVAGANWAGRPEHATSLMGTWQLTASPAGAWSPLGRPRDLPCQIDVFCRDWRGCRAGIGGI